MTGNAIAELDRQLIRPLEGDKLAQLEERKRGLSQAGKEYAQEVQTAVRPILGAAKQFKEGWELIRREVVAGHADEVQRVRDRFLGAFEERLADLRKADTLVQFAAGIAATELPEAQQLRDEIGALGAMLERLAGRWRTTQDLEKLVPEDQVS